MQQQSRLGHLFTGIPPHFASSLFSGKPLYIEFAMLQALKKYVQTISLGAVASALLHVIILLLLVFGLPELTLEPEEPEVIQVELVVPVEEPPPEQEQEQEPEPEPEPTPAPEETASADQADVQPAQIFRPVYEFGEKDAGPRESEEGDDVGEAEVAEAQADEEPTETPDTPQETVSALEAPSGEPIAVPEPTDELPKPEESTETTRSVHNDNTQVAISAMGELPRGIRAGELCVTELRLQLLGSLPPYWPDLLPTYRLDEGTILQVRKGAFRSRALWYNLQFRCEIDEAATKVVSFEFNVGSPVPRAEWGSRGLPAS